MKYNYGKRNDKPAPRHMTCCQERTYACEADANRAWTQMRKSGRWNGFTRHYPDTGFYSVWASRFWTQQEVEAAGGDYTAYEAWKTGTDKHTRVFSKM